MRESDNNHLIHPLIKPGHLLRKAICYLRQSTEEQVKFNIGSQAYQRSQADIAKAFGWPDSLIEVIDEDLGLSGSATGHRTGWQKMTQEVRADTVGAVFATDISRLSRRLQDFLGLCSLCARHDVLLVMNGRVIDPRDPNDVFSSRIWGSVVEYENDLRAEKMKMGRRAKAREGYVVSNMPIGWTKRPDGSYDFDPETKDTIRLVVRTFWEARSLRGTVAALIKGGVVLPSRYRRGKMVWKKPAVDAVKAILTNPAYAGVYVYGKTRSAPEIERPANGRIARRPLPEEQWIKIYNRHPGYMTPQQQEEIKAVLKGNAFPHGKHPRRGAALCQGLLICAQCGARLTVRYGG